MVLGIPGIRWRRVVIMVGIAIILAIFGSLAMVWGSLGSRRTRG
jgi:hypothetical protein